MGAYDDIINLPHHVSTRHPQISAIGRAAQFSPFAALTGFEEEIKETGRLTDSMIELSEDEQANLDVRLRKLEDALPQQPWVTITYFAPDKRKVGGAYITASGTIKKFDRIEKRITLLDGTVIPIDAIWQVDSSYLDETMQALNESI